MKRSKLRDEFGQRQYISNESGIAPGDFGGAAENPGVNRKTQGDLARGVERKLKSGGSPVVDDVQDVPSLPVEADAARDAQRLSRASNEKPGGRDVSDGRNPSVDLILNRVADGARVLGE